MKFILIIFNPSLPFRPVSDADLRRVRKSSPNPTILKSDLPNHRFSGAECQIWGVIGIEGPSRKVWSRQKPKKLKCDILRTDMLWLIISEYGNCNKTSKTACEPFQNARTSSILFFPLQCDVPNHSVLVTTGPDCFRKGLAPLNETDWKSKVKIDGPNTKR